MNRRNNDALLDELDNELLKIQMKEIKVINPLKIISTESTDFNQREVEEDDTNPYVDRRMIPIGNFQQIIENDSTDRVQDDQRDLILERRSKSQIEQNEGRELTYKDWSSIEVVEWLTRCLRLQIETAPWFIKEIQGRDLEHLTDEDLENELEVRRSDHRRIILQQIRTDMLMSAHFKCFEKYKTGVHKCLIHRNTTFRNSHHARFKSVAIFNESKPQVYEPYASLKKVLKVNKNNTKSHHPMSKQFQIGSGRIGRDGMYKSKKGKEIIFSDATSSCCKPYREYQFGSPPKITKFEVDDECTEEEEWKDSEEDGIEYGEYGAENIGRISYEDEQD